MSHHGLWRSRVRRRLSVITAAVLLQLAGCGVIGGRSEAEPGLPVAGVLRLSVSAADYMNPDVHDQPCPVVLRLYQLDDCGIVQKYRFLDLYRQADHLLGNRLLAERELAALYPGQQLRFDLPLVRGAACLVAVAGMSRYQQGQPMAWLPVSGSAPVQVRVEGLRVVVMGGA